MAKDDLTTKQEAFAFAYVETGNAAEAYRRAYDVGPDTKPTTVWVESCKLRSIPKVSQRIDELRSQMSEAGMVTLQGITQDLRDAHKMAKDLEQPHNMVKATTEIAKLHGLSADKLEITGKDGGAIETKDLSKNDIARRIALALAKGMKEKSDE